jgi:uncharacterized DUF497 family protein
MAFEWDEPKRLANLAKHGVDFAAAKLIFEGPTVEFPESGATMASSASARMGKSAASSSS